jgi:hypothetical protein
MGYPQKTVEAYTSTIGSRGFAKIPSAKRKKMGDKTVPCRLLGYQGSTNYVLVDDDGKIFFANNVVFDEKFLLRKRDGSDQLTGEPNAKRMDFTPSLPTVPITENSRTEEVQTTPHQSNPPDQNGSNIHVELGTPERTQSPNGAVDEQQAATGEAEHHPNFVFQYGKPEGKYRQDTQLWLNKTQELNKTNGALP